LPARQRETDRAHGGGEFDIDFEGRGGCAPRVQHRQQGGAAFRRDIVEEVAGVTRVQMHRQDVGRAVPGDDAVGYVPVEAGCAGGLRRKAQAQFIFQRGKLGDLISLLQCGVQHYPPSRAGFSGLC